ncbi:MAG: EVE domain-containing protein [Phycisphaerales bacterium]|nr:EVE domain-containing protein [Phycisphaerales bacterium]
MPNWLIKSEPDEYSARDLARDQRTTWDGVRNAAARLNLRAMRAGDRVLLYHTGGEKAVVATARVAGDPQPDPADESQMSVLVDVVFEEFLKRPVTLGEIKADDAFASFDLVRISRLSVMPVSSDHWKRIIAMSKKPLS